MDQYELKVFFIFKKKNIFTLKRPRNENNPEPMDIPSVQIVVFKCISKEPGEKDYFSWRKSWLRV